MSAPTLERTAPAVVPAAPVARVLRAPLRALPAARELLLLALLYVGYTTSRLLADGDVAEARRHARQVLSVERFLDIDVEHVLNDAVLHVRWLEVGAAYWYAVLHYVVTPAVLLLVWRRGPAVYRPARRALVLATAAALVGFLLFPTAPPRLLGGYTDVLDATSAWGWWGAHASAPRGLGGATNELAAMPSMHVGWAVWVALVLAGLARHRWQRAAAYAYAVGTLLVVVVTANHWLLDGVVGGALMLAALGVAGVAPVAGRTTASRRTPISFAQARTF
ncbi:PAP2 superfamily protein [Motilibacter peucedani]|uniref:PAP2 superfamily protein n=1 Tax=Motilibacter peucedani TaxID=598650 RepID=A0A420XU07_9ACTN|nr:phosphatase PAP2 family protein [Motilibacter peucedani]RKS80326.1 PAP2 superfamily protein [Motilibacter peucedani]